MNPSNETSKLIRTSQIIDRILLILQALAAVCGGIAALGGILILLFHGAIEDAIRQNATAPVKYSLDGLIISFTDDVRLTADAPFFASAAISVFSAVLMTTLLWYGLRLVRRILLPMKEGRPFETGVSGTIRRLAWLTVAGGVIEQLCDNVLGALLTSQYDLSSLLNSGLAVDITYQYSFDADFLLTAAILFLLSMKIISL